MEGRDLRRSRMPPAARSGTRSPLKYKVKTHTLSRTQSGARGGARSWPLPRFALRSGVSGWAGRHFQVLPLRLATRLKKKER